MSLRSCGLLAISHMTNFSRALIQSWPRTISQRVVLRTQGPITPGLKVKKKASAPVPDESPRRRDERNCAHAGVPAFAGRLIEASRVWNSIAIALRKLFRWAHYLIHPVASAEAVRAGRCGAPVPPSRS